MKIFYVVWYDAVSNNDWELIDDARKQRPVMVQTVGFCVSCDSDRITLALSKEDHDDHDGRVSDFITIPRSHVRDIRVVDPYKSPNRVNDKDL